MHPVQNPHSILRPKQSAEPCGPFCAERFPTCGGTAKKSKHPRQRGTGLPGDVDLCAGCRQINFCSFHLAQMRLHCSFASSSACSGVSVPVAAFANITGMTQVL